MRDDLETLDDDLAAGRIDASTYRRRRDGLLAADPADPADPADAPPVPAVPPLPPPDSPDSPDSPDARAAASVRDPDPFPPPFRWDTGAAPRRQPSPPVPAHVTTPPWHRGAARPTSGETRARMQGPEVFAPGGPRPLAVLGAVLVVALALAVLVASFLL